MNKKDLILKFEIPNLFCDCFRNAIKDVEENNYEFKILSEKRVRQNTKILFEVEANEVEAFYHLGKQYANLRNKI
jgi:hypothetical protein